MIHYNPTTRIFNLSLRHSYYACQVDEQGALVHVGWGPRPADAAGDWLSGAVLDRTYESPYSFLGQYRPDEVLTFGDLTLHQATLKVSFPTLPGGLAARDAAHFPIRDLRLRYVSHSITTDGAPGLAPALPVAETGPRETLRIRLGDPAQPFFVSACYRLTPEQDVIERWLELENAGAETVTVDECYFATLHLPNGTTELTTLTGTWAREYNLSRQRLTPGTHLLESRTLQTSHLASPVVGLNRPGQAGEESGLVYFAALAYSGAWRMAIEHLPTADVRVHAGYNPFDFRLNLAPGETHRTPALVLGLSPDGWGGASRRLHAFALERVAPRPAGQPAFRPVLYNSWEATTFNLSHDQQVGVARQAAALGVELFCVDDGWFGARRDDTAGLGDWVVRADAFPDGLAPLAAEVHGLGMQFGLWVEPEMVNPDSDLYRQHPDWVLHFPGRPRTEARFQLILDFGRPEVVEYIFAALDRLVRDYAVDFFKWDMNRYASEPGSVAGQAIWERHTAAVYAIIDRLRQTHPGLEVQSCSGGGGRTDLGILARVDQVWTSDNTDAFDRLAIQEGYSLAYPARAMEAWVTHAPNPFTRRDAPLSLRFDVAMRGALGIGTNLDILDEAEQATYASYIRFFKRIRPVVHTGRLYRLERLEEFGASVIEYVTADGREAVYSLAIHTHTVNRVRPAPPLRGLHSRAVYALYDRDDHEVGRASGYELMTLGIREDSAAYSGYSRTLSVRLVPGAE